MFSGEPSCQMQIRRVGTWSILVFDVCQTWIQNTVESVQYEQSNLSRSEI